jgi:hypothetical protein
MICFSNSSEKHDLALLRSSASLTSLITLLQWNGFQRREALAQRILNFSTATSYTLSGPFTLPGRVAGTLRAEDGRPSDGEEENPCHCGKSNPNLQESVTLRLSGLCLNDGMFCTNNNKNNTLSAYFGQCLCLVLWRSRQKYPLKTDRTDRGFFYRRIKQTCLELKEFNVVGRIPFLVALIVRETVSNIILVKTTNIVNK